MKKISIWANVNRNRARALIVVIKLTLAAMAYYTGISLYKMQVVLPARNIDVILGTLVLAAIVFYPSKKHRAPEKKFRYLKQKSCDFVLAACSFVMIVTMVNTPDAIIPSSPGAYGSSIIIKKGERATEILRTLDTREKGYLSHKEKRILRKEFVRQLKVYAVAAATGNKQKADDALKIILVIIGALGLLYLLSALVCGLSCSGSDGAALIVGLLGLAAVIWGVVFLIKRITRGPKKEKKE